MLIFLWIDEKKLRAGIDHAADQPAARRPIDLDSPSSDPPSPLHVVSGLTGLLSTRDTFQTLFDFSHSTQDLILSRRFEEIDGAYLAISLPQLSQRNAYV